jgi:hypothetical protein
MGHPGAVIDYLITHRLAREQKVERALEKLGSADLKNLTAAAYEDVPPALHGVASRSALAHLLKLETDGRASQQADHWQAAEKHGGR